MFQAHAQPTSAAATPPTRSASDVVSLFSDAYTNVAATDWFPNWGQSTIVTDILVAGNPTKKYESFNYQGVQFASAVNASSMTDLHIDIWTPNCTAFDFYLINTSPSTVEQKVTLTPTLSGWNSFDIDLSQYTTIALNNIGQFKLVGTPFGSSTVYFDNVYFWKSANTPTITGFSIPAKLVGAAPFAINAPNSNSPGAFSYSSSNTNVATISGSTITVVGAGTSIITVNQAPSGSFGSASATTSFVVSFPPPATAAPNPPTRLPSNVVSIFSGAYTNAVTADFFPNWGQGTTFQLLNIAGNSTLNYNNLDYEGIDFASTPLNVSSMTKMHLDIWTPNVSPIAISLIANGENAIILTPTLSGWNSFDINLTDYSNAGRDLTNVIQIKLEKPGFVYHGEVNAVYIDNIYFWKSANTPTLSGFSIPPQLTTNNDFTISPPNSNSPGSFSYTSSNASVATIVNGNMINLVGAGTSIITATQAASGTYTSASITATLVVSFPPPTIAAPGPPFRNAPDVISLFGGAYTNVAGTDWFPNWGQSTLVSDIIVAGNTTKKYEFLNYQGVQFAAPIDASQMTNLHIDIWTPNCTAFDVFLINTGASTVEQSVTLTPTLSGWNSYNIALSQFNTINLSNIGQFKLVGTPFGSSTVYLDNIYFYKNTNAPTVRVTQPTCALATGTITVLSSTAGLTFSIDGSTYTNTTGVFSGVATGTYNVTSKTSTGTVSSPGVAVVNAQPVISLQPSAVVGTKNINQCDTLQSYSVIAVSGYTYLWVVSGSGNYVKSGQGTRAVVLVMKSAGVVYCYALNACNTKSIASTLAVLKSAPTTPGAIRQSFVPLISANTNTCMFNQSAFASTGKPDTFRIVKVLNATGYLWEAPTGSIVNRLNDTTITVIFPDTITISAISPRYIKVYSLSNCDTSAPRILALARTVAATPGVVQKGFFPNVTAVTSVCALVPGGTETYKIRKVASANSYNWYMIKGTNATITHLNPNGVNDTAITVTYGAGFTKDSIIVKSINGCTMSAARVLSVSSVFPSPTPTSVTSSTASYNACIGNSIQYSVVVAAPTATQALAVKYRWTIPANTAITATNADSSIVTVSFQTGYVGGTMSVRGITLCNVLGTAKSVALTHTGCPIGTKDGNGIVGRNVVAVANELKTATVYPNPNRGSFTFRMETGVNDNAPATVQVIDVFGRVVSQFTANNNAGTISKNVSDNKIGTGIYTVKYTIGSVTQSLKMIVQ